MFWSRKYGARRTEVRKNRPDRRGADWYAELKAKGVIGSLVVAGVFALVASAIVMLREDAVPYKPGQYVPQDIISRVDFTLKPGATTEEVVVTAVAPLVQSTTSDLGHVVSRGPRRVAIEGERQGQVGGTRLDWHSPLSCPPAGPGKPLVDGLTKV